MAYNYVMLAVALSTGYLLWSLLQALRNPLNAIPGTWHAKFTNLPGVLATLSKQQTQYYHALHRRFGPFVRTGPRQVFVADLDAFKAIHRIGGRFNKADYYHYFGTTEAGKPPYGLFQMTDPADHARRRKLLGAGFTATSLRSEWEAMVAGKVEAAVTGMREEAKLDAQGEVDVRKWWNLMACDVISTIMFGKSFDALKAGRKDPWFDAVMVTNQAAFAALSFPWLYEVLKSLPVIGNAPFFQAHKELLGKGKAAVKNSRQKWDGNDSSSSGGANLFAKVLREADPEEGGRLTDDDIVVEAGSFMIAGTDTTSNTLTYLVWAVLSHPELQAALETELQATFEEPSLISDAALEKLPILHAVIEETLRLHGAAPMPLPRIVPPGGVELGGYHIPGGTEVATQAWTMHRDPRFYTDPDKFDHTRWLPGGECMNSEAARAAFAPFGAGSRGCIGKQLAYMELRYGAAMFFRAFRGCRLGPSATPESMVMDNIVLIEPRGKVLKVVLPRTTANA